MDDGASPAVATDGATGGSRAEVFAWAMYDWANSAYSTILITIVHGYLTNIAFAPTDDWGPTVYAWGISVSMVTAALLSPVVGAVADINRSKRRWLAATALPGAGAAVLLAGLAPESTWAIVGLFVFMSLCFELSLGVYNGFLPEIATERTMNTVSAWGFALGYLGGALALILELVVMQYGEALGLPDKADQLRVGILIMGLWWGLFSLPTLKVLRDRGGPPAMRQPIGPAARKALQAVGSTLRNVRQYRMLAWFLLGFLLYNEGIQTVISQASTFATKTPELSFTTSELAMLILMIQFIALPGAILVGWLSNRIGERPALQLCLAVFVGLLVAAFFVNSKSQFWCLGVVLALVMGGSQSVSRAIMGLMTPPARTAEFFGFFNFSGKATSFLGPFVFGSIFKVTGNTRLAVLSLLVFFLVGWAIVARVRIDEGRRQALLR